MASSPFYGTPGAAGERERVFCHICQIEWTREGQDSLECPRCGDDFTEIIDPSNDPRAPHGIGTPSDLSTGSGRHFHRPGGSDSDPDEGDIEEHIHEPPPRLFMRSLFEPPLGGPDDRDREGNAILHRFADMLLHDLGGARAVGGMPAPGMFSQEEHVHQHGPRVQQTTFRTGPFGTRVTITSGTVGGGPGEPPFNNFGTYVRSRGPIGRFRAPHIRVLSLVGRDMANSNDPDRLFGQLLGNPMMPGPGEGQRRPGFGTPPGPAFGGGLHDLLASLFNPAAAVHGDAVYTQEALDRIITQLMEASPQTNAAPPASQAAIDNLEKKRVDDQMLGPDGKAECTICIDEINKGDEVVVLPCKHWYHGECVVLWLKEHNTCPICRMPIETREGNGNNHNRQQGRSSQPNSPSGQEPSPSASSAPSSNTFSPLFPFGSLSGSGRSRGDRVDRGSGSTRAGGSGGDSWRFGDSWRSDSQQRQSGLHRRNSLSPPLPSSSDGGAAASRSSRVRSPSMSRDRDRDRDRGRDWHWDEDRGRERLGEAFYAVTSEWNSRDTQGRRSQRENREQENREQQRQQSGGGSSSTGHGGGALNWLRDHFGRGTGSGGGSGGADRDRRR
ncbi:hypothetical protein N656DRAFT_798492 [Canariomyces notabilis]|uniref:RING-type E3 ubiquitin transferase n=1 Tax=Canariomyces notabilis TaxID=2074819 RepID=A0AAN6TD01_9PEZI|nr:hypothetical protein N656DRAFT_798492 [Canariomyces arenarius]